MTDLQFCLLKSRDQPYCDLSPTVSVQCSSFSKQKTELRGVTRSKKWAILCLFFIYFRSFQTNNTNLKQTNVKNSHPVSGAGILTHNLLIMSLLL